LGAAGAVTVGAVGSLVVAGLWIRWFPQLWRRQTLNLPDTGIERSR
jgi:uncharacterized protein (DUF2062 family)